MGILKKYKLNIDNTETLEQQERAKMRREKEKEQTAREYIDQKLKLYKSLPNAQLKDFAMFGTEQQRMFAIVALKARGVHYGL